jgi:hypothetical protein
MSKFTFVYQNEDVFTEEVTSKVTMETNAESLSELLEEFECFLRGAGYYFEGKLDLVDQDDDFSYDDEDDNEDINAAEEFFRSESPISASWPFPTEKGPS